ncbi:MAG: transcriptional regulator [Bacteroidetes bacterium HGW-Bacteroidetes-6]|jgi:dTDP-4-amino-4,6-dideoxygalactose transaminase|nr:MAG: transcriptional regulator [Bacteroidetes bacterium HGW-Bacteroidetes-6]
MKPIRMVDLAGQYEKIKEEVDTAIAEVMNTTAFINGPAVQRFQKNLEEYLGVKHVIPCANGTDALQVAMMALDLKPGDEVITTSFTFIATAEVIALLHLTPVLVDVEKDTFNISIEAIRKAITPKTKAIVPVHLFGQSVPMEELMALAKEFNLYVIEDACQSIGSDYIFADGSTKKTGAIGHVGCTSFFPSKNLGCFGDGGAIFTNDDALAEKLRIVVNHGMKVRYYHDEIGVNSRLDSIQAAVLDVKLKNLDSYIDARRSAADFYDRVLGNNSKLIVPARYEKSRHVFHQYTLVANGFDRNKLIAFLQEKGIPAMIYYPVPLHLQKAYIDPRYKQGDFPNTEWLSENVFSLPMHTELDEEQLQYITGSILEFLNK